VQRRDGDQKMLKRASLAKASTAIGLIALLLFSLAVIVFFSWPELQKCFASGDKIVITARCVGHVAYHYREAVNAVATVFVALFTFTLWRSTEAMMSATRQTAILTRDTVNLAREEFISTHRPRLRVRQFNLDTLTPNNPLVVRFALRNIGETKAHWRTLAVDVVLWNEREGFWETPIDEIVKPLDNCRPIKSGQRLQTNDFASRFNVTAEQIDAIKSGELIVCVVGELGYADDLGVMRRTGFRRNYNPLSNLFEPTPNPDQEYED
jgi:hypothetical protein